MPKQKKTVAGKPVRPSRLPHSVETPIPGRQKRKSTGEMAPGTVELVLNSGLRVAIRTNFVGHVQDGGVTLVTLNNGVDMQVASSYDETLRLLGWLIEGQ